MTDRANSPTAYSKTKADPYGMTNKWLFVCHSAGICFSLGAVPLQGIRSNLLAFIVNPDHATLLFLAGIFLLYAEFNRPGAILFGCLGALSLTLGLDGLLHLPLAVSALAAILASLPLLALGIFFPRFNLWTTVSGILLGIGLVGLTPGVHSVVAWATAILFTATTTWLLRVALRARRNKLPQPRSGRESMRPNVQHTVKAPATDRPTA